MAKEIKVNDHMLVPKHEVLGNDEAEKLLVKYNISKKQMPRISGKDPALGGMNIKKGDVIKITRMSSTAHKAIFYRVVAD